MRIHSNTLTLDDLSRATYRANVTLVRHTQHGSRSHARAFDVILSGNGITGGMYGNLDYRTASWDEWGMFLAALFDADPVAVVPRVYEGADHFHWATGDRFRTLTPQLQHKRHNWLSGDLRGPSAAGSYHVQSCQCGAVCRHVAHGYTWSGISANV